MKIEEITNQGILFAKFNLPMFAPQNITQSFYSKVMKLGIQFYSNDEYIYWGEFSKRNLTNSSDISAN